MQIQELAKRTGVPAKTIRYYESIGLMPAPERAENNYRQYTPDAIERLRYIASARSLGFSLTDIGEFLLARDAGTLPCQRVMDSVEQRIADIERRIADLLVLRDTLNRFRDLGGSLPPDKKCDELCTDYMVEKVQEYELAPLPIELDKSIPATGDQLK